MLAHLYDMRGNGERRSNVERALRFYRESLRFFRRDTHPEDWAQIHTLMGIAYGERIAKTKPASLTAMLADLRAARVELETALMVYTREMYPEEHSECRQLLSWCVESIDRFNRRREPADMPHERWLARRGRKL